jgi:hypothetical protein
MQITQREFNSLRKKLEGILKEKKEKLYSARQFMDRQDEDVHWHSSGCKLENYVDISNRILKYIAIETKCKFNPFDATKIINSNLY